MNELQPIVRHVILCEDVVVNPDNPLRITLVGVMSSIRSIEEPAYPLLYEELCVFVQLTSCRGPGDLRIEIQHGDSADVVYRNRTRTVPLSRDPLEVLALSFRIRNCLFAQAGLYWIQVWYNGQNLAQQALVMK